MSQRIGLYEQLHCGGKILILGNGPSCKLYDVACTDAEALPVIGLNQAWRLFDRRRFFYLCMGDQEQYTMFAEAHPPTHIYGGVRRPLLFTTETGPEYAVRVKGHHNDPEHPKRFSFDLAEEGVYLNNTIASFGFQLAVWMLGRHGTICLLGIDSDGPQFDGSPVPPGTWENQRETLGYIAGVLRGERPGIRIYDLSPVSKQRVFERRRFEEVFSG